MTREYTLGLSNPTLHTETALMPLDALLNAIQHAKHDRQTKGRGTAYHALLNQFHRAILPAFLAETNGSLSEAARLLGLHRTTVADYAQQANLDPKAFAAEVAA